MEKPLVSIVIPVYNGANFMREAIDSALAQTYGNIEVIVVNDGSCDNGQTDFIARSYGNHIRYFTKPNGGVSSALNFGIRQMRGEYFSWLSHDDVYELNKIEKQVEQLTIKSERTLICCQCTYIDEQSRRMNGYFPRSGFRSRLYDWKEALYAMLEKATINGCCLLIPKEAFEICGGFDESLRFCQDVFMWYRLFLAGYALCYSEENLVKSRVHRNQLTQTGQTLFRRECYAISDYLMNAFAHVSNKDHNFLKKYLLSDAKYLPFKKVREISSKGKKSRLISVRTAIKAYMICGYGKVRPLLRKLYYRFFRKMQTK